MWEICYYETARGSYPIQEFIDRQNAKTKAKIARTIDMLEQFGILLGLPYAKHIEGDLWELRTRLENNRYRIIYFLSTGRNFILLHGFVKKTGKIPPKELKIARNRRDAFLAKEN